MGHHVAIKTGSPASLPGYGPALSFYIFTCHLPGYGPTLSFYFFYLRLDVGSVTAELHLSLPKREEEKGKFWIRKKNGGISYAFG